MKKKNHFVVCADNSILNVFDDIGESVLYAKKIFKISEKKFGYDITIKINEVGDNGVRNIFAIWRPFSGNHKKPNKIKIFNDNTVEWTNINKILEYLE